MSSADASPAVWQDVVGVPIDTPRDVSFVLMSEVTYGEITEVLAGLDYAYPEAAKVGGLCSAASGGAKRTLIWWSARGDAQNFTNGLVTVRALSFVCSNWQLAQYFSKLFWLVSSRCFPSCHCKAPTSST